MFQDRICLNFDQPVWIDETLCSAGASKTVGPVRFLLNSRAKIGKVSE